VGNVTSWVLFFIFGVVLVAMYLLIRRQILSPLLVGALGVIASIVLMTLNSLAQNNTIYQAIFVGFSIGGLFSVGILAMALYFLRNETRRAPNDAPQNR